MVAKPYRLHFGVFQLLVIYRLCYPQKQRGEGGGGVVTSGALNAAGGWRRGRGVTAAVATLLFLFLNHSNTVVIPITFLL